MKPTEKTTPKTLTRDTMGKTKKDSSIGKLVAKKLTRQPPTQRSERSKPSAANSALPMTSVLDDRSVMERACELLKLAHKLKKIRDKADAEIKEHKEELAAIAMSQDLPGLRYGACAIQVNGYVSRETFDKDQAKALMLEYGVPPAKVGKCYKKSEEYLDTKLVELAL